MPKNYRRLKPTGTKMYFVQEIQGHEMDEEKFQQVVDAGEPVVIRKLPFGESTHKWTLDYLSDKLGEQEVVIHESKEHYELDFIKKNFVYKKCKFMDFAQEVRDRNSQRAVYLRSTCRDPKRKRPARIEDDFPAIADDLRPPDFIPFGRDNEKYYSSVLRISSRNSRLWTHFDLYDNVLCQVFGVKTVFLFPPTDSKFLYLDGDKSIVQDIDDWKNLVCLFPKIIRTQPFQVHLHPGDCLFIPSMWWHQVLLDEKHNKAYSIGFNIFWKDTKLERESLYAPNDIYGNKNLPPYDAALANLDKAIKHLNMLPGKYGEVYKEMFNREVQKRLGCVSSS